MKLSYKNLLRLASSADSKRSYLQTIKERLALNRPSEDLHKEGSEFFNIVRDLECKCSTETMDRLLRARKKLSLFDCICAACSILDDMDSCLWHCEGGDHSVHYLCGKVSSHCKAALCLLRNGYYDEALALCRIIGETANLLCLFYSDGQQLKKWGSLEEGEKRREFEPVKVRIRLEDSGIANLPIDKERYKELSVRSVHASPHTRPNEYNCGRVPSLGSIFQEDGLNRVLPELARLLCLVTFFGSKLLQIPDRPKRTISMHILSIAESMDICLDSYGSRSTNSA